MKTIMGVKLMDDEEINKYSGGHTPLCNHLKAMFTYGVNFLDDIKDENKLIFDTGRAEGTRFNMLKEYKFIFVPTELVHERFFAHSIINAMNMTKGVLMDPGYHHRADEVIEKYQNRYDELSSRYNGFDNIFGTQCYLFLFDGTKLEDVVIAHPPVIMANIIDKKSEYHCSTCRNVVYTDNKSIDSFLPDMRYEVDIPNNIIKYYCNDCVKANPKLQKMKHVGEKSS